MPTTTRELITKSYYIAGIVSRDFETVSGTQITDGLDVLNELLDEKVVDWDMIPFENDGLSARFDSVRVRTQSELSATYNNGAGTLTAAANGAITIDGIALAVSDRVLVTQQVTGNSQLENGIYAVTDAGSATTPYVLTRATDASTSAQFFPSKAVVVEEGTDRTKNYYYNGENSPVIGTTAITFAVSSASPFFYVVPGQESYYIPNLIAADTLTFLKDDVRYSMEVAQRGQYFGSTRAENINSLPNSFHVQRVMGGATIYMYFKPDQAYLFEIRGTFRLANVTLDQDLELTVDGFYRTYMKYALAEKLCTVFNYDVPESLRRELGKQQAFISKSSRPLDLSMVKSSTLQDSRGGLNWGQVNLGRGWTTPRRR